MTHTNDYTQDQLNCYRSIEYFAEKYITVHHSVNGLVPVNLSDFQRSVIHAYQNGDKKIFSRIGDRQEGKTVVASIILLHTMIFHEYKNVVIFAPKLEWSNSILYGIHDMYNRLDEKFKTVTVASRNKTSIEFSNGSQVISVGKNADRCKGRTISVMYIDEADWVKDLEGIMRNLYPVVASLPDSKIFALTSSRVTEMFNR